MFFGPPHLDLEKPREAQNVAKRQKQNRASTLTGRAHVEHDFSDEIFL